MTNTTLMAMMILATNTTELKTNTTEHWHNPATPWTAVFETNAIYWDSARQRWWNKSMSDGKEKWVVTEVVRVKKLSFDWNGPRSVEDIDVLSRTTNHLRLVESWKPADPEPVITNMPATNWLVRSNFFHKTKP